MAENTVHEEWRPVVGHEGRYEVSSFGRVRSLLKTRQRPRSPDGILTYGNSKGYRLTTLCIPRRRVATHVLVCEAFVGPKPTPRHQVNHKNKVILDNRAENLEWATPSENQRHSFRLGRTVLCGDRAPWAKITSAQVDRIRELSKSGRTGVSLAREFGVSGSLVSLIVKRKRWSSSTLDHLPHPPAPGIVPKS